MFHDANELQSTINVLQAWRAYDSALKYVSDFSLFLLQDGVNLLWQVYG